MADETTDGVMNALVRLMNGDTDLSQLSKDELYAVLAAARGGRDLVRRVALELNRQGDTYEEIGARFGRSESAAYRWAYPEKKPSRAAGAADDDALEE